MEVLYGEDDGSIKAASQRLLGAAFVCDERFEHGPHHVQLQRERKMRRSGASPPPWGKVSLCCIYIFLFFLQMSVLRKHCLKEAPV